MKLTTARIGGAMGIAISGAIMSYTVGSNRLATEQIASAPEVFLKSSSVSTHRLAGLAILSVVFSAMRGARKD